METRLDFRSMRAAKARFGVKFGKVLDLLAVIIALLLLFGGLALLIMSESIGWLLLGLAAWPMMVHIW